MAAAATVRWPGGHLNSKGRQRQQKAAFQDGWSNRPVAVARDRHTNLDLPLDGGSGRGARAVHGVWDEVRDGGFYPRPSEAANKILMDT